MSGSSRGQNLNGCQEPTNDQKLGILDSNAIPHFYPIDFEYIELIKIVILVFQGHLKVTPEVNRLCDIHFKQTIVNYKIGLTM